MVTASYVNPELASLHESAVQAGIVIMNECGLDPGIDHMLAMECIDRVHRDNGKVNNLLVIAAVNLNLKILSFESWCGGLPHSSFADNPLKYKFRYSCSGFFLIRNI